MNRLTPERVRTADAARITGLSTRTLQEKAAAGLIPGARKVFGRWTYDAALLKELGNEPTILGRQKRAVVEGRIARAKVADICAAYERVLMQSRRGK